MTRAGTIRDQETVDYNRPLAVLVRHSSLSIVEGDRHIVGVMPMTRQCEFCHQKTSANDYTAHRVWSGFICLVRALL